jgi:hypothetical protein
MSALIGTKSGQRIRGPSKISRQLSLQPLPLFGFPGLFYIFQWGFQSWGCDSSPVVGDGVVYFTGIDANIYAVGDPGQ